MSASLFDEVRQVIADVFGLALNDVTAESSPETIPQWDAVQHLNLVWALEQRFRLAFAPEEIEQMRRVDQAAELVAIKLSQADASNAHP
jgi:acyl carrier protein